MREFAEHSRAEIVISRDSSLADQSRRFYQKTGIRITYYRGGNTQADGLVAEHNQKTSSLLHNSYLKTLPTYMKDQENQNPEQAVKLPEEGRMGKHCALPIPYNGSREEALAQVEKANKRFKMGKYANGQ